MRSEAPSITAAVMIHFAIVSSPKRYVRGKWAGRLSPGHRRASHPAAAVVVVVVRFVVAIEHFVRHERLVRIEGVPDTRRNRAWRHAQRRTITAAPKAASGRAPAVASRPAG